MNIIICLFSSINKYGFGILQTIALLLYFGIGHANAKEIVDLEFSKVWIDSPALIWQTEQDPGITSNFTLFEYSWQQQLIRNRQRYEKTAEKLIQLQGGGPVRYPAQQSDDQDAHYVDYSSVFSSYRLGYGNYGTHFGYDLNYRYNRPHPYPYYGCSFGCW